MTYLVTGVLIKSPDLFNVIHQIIKADDPLLATCRFEVDGWQWAHVDVYPLTRDMLAKIPVEDNIPFGQQPEARQLGLGI